ncbi:MAG: carboxypeptidase-like regulatory domain-containing protein [Pseudomonadota bacterium]
MALCSSLPAWAGEVAGTVFDARGRAVAGVALELAGQQAVSGADGAFTFSDVAEGQHSVIAGSQAVAVTVPAEGAVRRNVFLLSGAARARVTGEVAIPADNAAVLAETVRLAAMLLAEGDDTSARRVTDLTG